jgi:hypothetical protein
VQRRVRFWIGLIVRVASGMLELRYDMFYFVRAAAVLCGFI